MSMHLTHAGLTTLNTGRNKKKPSVKQNRAAAEHDKWLRKQGLHPEQIAERQTAKSKTLKVETNQPPSESVKRLGNGFAPIVAKRSVFDSAWRRDYEDNPLMAEREAIALQQAEEKKKYIRPLYNKGPVQYSANTNDLKEGNGRGKRI
jgi:hypothetical protein